MSGSNEHRQVWIAAPAKLNLGLAIVGRRPDGYHDLVTILQAIDLVDDLVLRSDPDPALRVDPATVNGEENLALRALERLRTSSGVDTGARLAIAKRIPVAAGLGGASSDAAAALRAGPLLWNRSVADDALAALAIELGSDVPFFLAGGTALAEGRGERLSSLPTPSGIWFAIVLPRLAIPRKTATLFAAIAPGDLADGAGVRAQAELLRSGEAIDPALLGNDFSAPLARVAPALAELPDRLRRLSAPHVALSGAGPAHYVVYDDPTKAVAFARAAEDALGDAVAVTLARPQDHPAIPVLT